MLNMLRNFTIFCNLTTSELECNVSEGFAPVVPGTSYCQINNQPEPFECKKLIKYDILTSAGIILLNSVLCICRVYNIQFRAS